MPDREVTLEEAPPKARELFNKGFAAMERGNLDYAIDMFASCVTIAPLFLQARKFLRAAELRRFKQTNPGRFAHVTAMIKGLPGYLGATAALRSGKPRQAMEIAEKLLREDPLNKQFQVLFCHAAEDCNLPEVALQTMEIAREAHRHDVDLLFWLGRLYLKTEDPKRARACFEEVVRERPNDVNAIKALKDALAEDSMRTDGWQQAVEQGSYRDVIRDSREAEVLEREAKAVKTEKDRQILIEEQLEKIKREPANINFYRGLASLYADGGMFPQAFAAIEKARQVTGVTDPQLDRSLYDLRLRQFDHEIEELVRAGNAAAAASLRRQKEEYRNQSLNERVKRYPNDPQLRYELGMMLYEKGELNDAIQQFQISQRNPQRRIRSLFYIGMCFKAKRQFDLAVEQLEQARDELSLMDDTKKEILYELGGLYETTGAADKAAASFKLIYQADIGYRDIARKVEQIYSGNRDQASAANA